MKKKIVKKVSWLLTNIPIDLKDTQQKSKTSPHHEN